MKKLCRFIAVLVLTGCLLSFTLTQFAPASSVYAASLDSQESCAPTIPEKEKVSPTLTSHPFIFVAAGSVCALFIVLAVTPLLIGDPKLRREAGIDFE